jgi:adenylate cyclase
VTRSFLRGAISGLICAAIVSAIAVIDPTLFGSEWLLRDAFSRSIAAKRRPDPRIVLVTVSDQSVSILSQLNWGRPPYPRSLYAKAIDELRRAGASVVAFDILFPEEDAVHPEGDRDFAAALSTMPSVLAADTNAGNGGAKTVPPEFAPKLWNLEGGETTPFSTTMPLPLFRDAVGVGTIRLASSTRSASVHSYPTADPVGNGRAVPALAFEVVRIALGYPRHAFRTGMEFVVGSLRVPVDSRGEMIIRWNGSKVRPHNASDPKSGSYDPGMISYAHADLHQLVIAAMAHDDPSFAASLGDQAKKLEAFESQFSGKIVLIGYTAAGLFDLRPNPLSPVAPGLELHANAIDNLLNRDFARELPRGVVLPLILIAAAIFGALLYPIRSQFGSGALAAAFIGAALAVAYAALSHGIVVPNVAASAALALTYITITVTKFVAEQEQTAMLRATFGRYVSPQILDHILNHPESVHLGGERRDLTILFSDIRGFTSISEASEPEEVVEMLNEYLTRMVEILLAHGGTLDKFIGDAVMGFWNAPATDPDHARHAVACAVEMIRETAVLRERWLSEGKPSLRIGVGINTGEAVVGNIGAEKVFGYTVIGDAVNLASRLEGKNKDYGTEIIVSEFTKERMGDAFELVYLDEVKVKGKEKAVRIFQVKA